MSLDRRSFLGLAGTAAALPFARGFAQARAHRVDVHHHIVSPGYAAALRKRGDRFVSWTVEGSLADMDRSGIATAMTSLIQPAVWFGDVGLGRSLAREANEYAAQLEREHPGRFGTFATIPYPGCAKIPSSVSVGTIEYATDTTRTMASLMFKGAAAKFPDIKWIMSYSGGTAPFLVSRFVREEKVMNDREAKLPRGVHHELRKFYYDTAQGNDGGAACRAHEARRSRRCSTARTIRSATARR